MDSFELRSCEVPTDRRLAFDLERFGENSEVEPVRDPSRVSIGLEQQRLLELDGQFPARHVTADLVSKGKGSDEAEKRGEQTPFDP